MTVAPSGNESAEAVRYQPIMQWSGSGLDAADVFDESCVIRLRGPDNAPSTSLRDVPTACRLSALRRPPSLIEQRAGGKLGMARGFEVAAFEAVERALGGEEAETMVVRGDDAGGVIMDFDDGGSRHACSFAGFAAALLSDL
jgi:hypothetical protein